MKIIGILSIVFVLIFNSCSGSESEKSLSLKKGKYSYTMTDSTGKSLVEGVMILDSITTRKGTSEYLVKGTYSISSMTSDTSYYGFSSMNGGELTGYYDDKKK